MSCHRRRDVRCEASRRADGFCCQRSTHFTLQRALGPPTGVWSSQRRSTPLDARDTRTRHSRGNGEDTMETFEPQRTVTLSQVADWLASLSRSGNVACAVNPPSAESIESGTVDPDACYWTGSSVHQASLHAGDTPIRRRNRNGRTVTYTGHNPTSAIRAADRAEDRAILATARAQRTIARSGL